MLAAMSCRKAVLKAQASALVKGGTSRVLVRPGKEALAITAIPQERSRASARRKGLVISATFCVRGKHTRNGQRRPPFLRSGDVGEHTLAYAAGAADLLTSGFFR